MGVFGDLGKRNPVLEPELDETRLDLGESTQCDFS